jgi:hypothetical protein
MGVLRFPVLRNPVTTFSRNARRILGDKAIDRLVGGEVLKHFNVTMLKS